MVITSIVGLVKTYGVKNICFQIPMSKLELAGIIPGIAFKSSDSPMEPTLCTISEDRFDVKDHYKITLVAVNPIFGKEHFYQMDLESLLKDHSDEYKVFYLSIAEDGGDYFTQIKFE